MKPAERFKYFLPPIGAVLLLTALGSCAHTRSFIARAARTEGTVIRLERVSNNGPQNSSYGNNDTYTYRPVVRFESQGKSIVFASRSSSSPPSFSAGERVPVLYLESDPSSAEIDSFFSLYGFAVITGAIGGLLLLLGAAMIYWRAETPPAPHQTA
jgi:hypothetical protein